MKTTLNKIRAHGLRAGGWPKLLDRLGKTRADDEPLPIETILDLNGVDDAIWCLRGVEGHDREIRLFAVWCARQVQHLMTDPRSIAALDVADRFANGEATKRELLKAHNAAVAAAVAVVAVRAATYDAAYDVAVAVACTTVACAADAACATVTYTRAAYAADATCDAAYDVAYDVARAAQAQKLREICASST